MAKFFPKENTDKSQQTGAGFNLLIAGTKVTGDVKSENDFRLDGEVEGTIDCKGKLVLGQKSRVKGNVLCDNAEIGGEISGNILARETLSLRSTARVGGDIETKNLIIEQGAIFNGKCAMGAKIINKKNEQV